jgi:hypothetical protein
MGDVHIHIDPDLVGTVMRKTGLTATTVAELLSKGWAYKEELDKPPVWVHPMESLLETRMDFR